MKKVLTTVFGLTLLGASAGAADAPKVRVGGTLHTQYGVISQPKTFRKELGTENNGKEIRQNGLVNATELEIAVDGKLNATTKYGALIVLNADTYLDIPDDYVADKVMMFVENNSWGRFEAGSGAAVTKSMAVSANTIAVATGGINGVQQKWFNSRNADGTRYGEMFIKWPELPMRCDGMTNGNKITYYTPKFSGFGFGVSYSPDSSSRGTVAALKKVRRHSDSEFHNVFDLGVNYEGKLQNIGFKVGAIGQLGRAKHDATKRHDLKAWELGLKLDYAGLSVAGSYSDWGKSGTPKGRQVGAKYGAKYWTLGTAYAYKDVNMSVTYFNGKRSNVFLTRDLPANIQHDKGYNKNHYLSFGVDYNLAPGLLPYAEVTHFKAKRYGISTHNKGYVAIVGTKLAF
jgi:outer membrane protein OmpU